MKKSRFAIIGGTGLEEYFPEEGGFRIGTPYGPSAPIFLLEDPSKDVVFLLRHGKKHSIPPHKVNYRANIWALNSLGVERILASNAVGAIDETFKVGDFVVPSDFFDFTKSRVSTFYDEAPVTHVDVAGLYCPELRSTLLEASKSIGSIAHAGGVYLCTDGPRYESPAEIRVFKSWGCSVVGMTGIPEGVLARELGICYASLCYVTNMAAGIGGHVSAEEVAVIGRETGRRVYKVLLRALDLVPKRRGCSCSNSLEGARV
ncbi:MAG: S-methyl-5'-thioinosine phosphorylase [Candidatus Bathyarchaeia archaeon]